MKRQATERKKILAKGLAFKISKELLKLNNTRNNNNNNNKIITKEIIQLKNGQHTWTDPLAFYSVEYNQ